MRWNCSKELSTRRRISASLKSYLSPSKDFCKSLASRFSRERKASKPKIEAIVLPNRLSEVTTLLRTESHRLQAHRWIRKETYLQINLQKNWFLQINSWKRFLYPTLSKIRVELAAKRQVLVTNRQTMVRVKWTILSASKKFNFNRWTNSFLMPEDRSRALSKTWD